MLLRKSSSFVLGLVAMVLLVSMTVGVAGGTSHIITDKYIDVDPDGYWTAEVAAGGHQQWSFELAEPRVHNILIAITGPAGVSLGISLDGNNLGSTSGGEGFFTVSLEADPHAVTINNSGGVPVQYDFYMGISGDTTTEIQTDNPDPSLVNQLVTVVYTVVPKTGLGTPTGGVTVSDGVDSCGASVADGSCSLTLTTPGARTLTATYLGSPPFSGSSDTEPHIVLSVILVSIDIKPGSDPNCIKPTSKGRIPVAIDGSSVNINDIDVSTLELAGVGPPVRISTNKDVIGDSALDLVAHFSTPFLNNAGVLNDGAILSLTGQLNDGTEIEGSDQIFLAGEPNCFD